LGATVHYFATRFEQGERGGRRGAHQRLIDGGGAAEMTCGDGGWPGSRALVGRMVAASTSCLWGRGRRPGGSVSAREGNEGKGVDCNTPGVY
jgi:hypothetical protein